MSCAVCGVRDLVAIPTMDELELALTGRMMSSVRDFVLKLMQNIIERNKVQAL